MIQASSIARPLAAAALILFVAGCAAPKRHELVGTAWVLEAIGDREVSSSPLVTLQFTPGGEATGSGGCNEFSGDYRLDGKNLQFGALAPTQRDCDIDVLDREQIYLGALEHVTHYELREGNTLLLLTEDGRAVRLRRSAAAAS
jgi:heat shock protein HslJ